MFCTEEELLTYAIDNYAPEELLAGIMYNTKGFQFELVEGFFTKKEQNWYFVMTYPENKDIIMTDIEDTDLITNEGILTRIYSLYDGKYDLKTYPFKTRAEQDDLEWLCVVTEFIRRTGINTHGKLKTAISEGIKIAYSKNEPLLRQVNL